jgi:hypothetical protein
LAAKQKRKAKRATPGRVADAISRLDLMLNALETETRDAVRTKATLEAGNAIVMADYRGQTFDGADCYNVLHRSLQSALVLSLCRLFEVPRRRRGQSKATAFNSSDLGSIPAFYYLLKQKRCRTKLVERALGGWGEGSLGMSIMWKKDCLAALKRCDDTARRLASAPGRHASTTLSIFRDNQVAHLYAVPRPWTANRYNELFLLLDIASHIVSQSSIALRGRDLDFNEKEQIWIQKAGAFWKPALAAAITPDPSPVDKTDTTEFV